ncbi:MAG: chemotaxis protein CheW [Salinivirgaceae bacterium]|nr:chemotaxis protein CheW [Salinivirgaceae bacterium]
MEPNENYSFTIEQRKKILKERADRLKIPIKKEEISHEIIEGVEFKLASESYVIDSAFIVEIISFKNSTPLPCTPEFLLGIINVRGKIISLIDIKRFLNLPQSEITNLCKVIIVNHNGIELGILADEVNGSRQIFHKQLLSKMATVSNIQSDFIKGITKDRIIVLDMKAFLENEKIIINEIA